MAFKELVSKISDAATTLDIENQMQVLVHCQELASDTIFGHRATEFVLETVNAINPLSPDITEELEELKGIIKDNEQTLHNAAYIDKPS